MDDNRTTHQTDSDTRLRVRRRAARGLLATYIHELSDRHRSPDDEHGAIPGPPEPAIETPRGG
jgi:hypothetical protein